MSMSTRFGTAFVVVALVASALPAYADTYTYTYTGNGFTTFSNASITSEPPVRLPSPFTTSDSLMGYFTTSTPLPANLHDVFIEPSTESFNDGVFTFAQFATRGDIDTYLSTGASGTIVVWDVQDDIETGPAFFTTYGEAQPTQDFAYQFTDGHDQYTAQNYNAPGTWSESINGVPVVSSPVPEPSTFALLATGIVSLAVTTRRRFLAALPIHTR